MISGSTTAARSDALDRERFRDWAESPAGAPYRARLTSALEAARRVCDSSDDIRTIRRAQGQITAYEVALRLPQLILDEMSKRGNKT